MRRFLSLLCSFLGSSLLAAEVDPETTPGGEDLPLPAEGAAWVHEDAGLRLPQMLGDFQLESIHQWQEAAAGTGLRYYHKKELLRAEVFLYRAPEAMETREAKMAGVRLELGKIWVNATKVAKTGRYKELKNSPPQIDALNLPPKGETLLAHTSLYMEIQQRDSQPYEAQMWYGVIPFQRYWLRVRITTPKDSVEHAEQKSQAFVKALVQCVQEPGMRAAAVEAIAAYKEDPLSEPSRVAGDFVALYARDNPLFQIVVPRQVTEAMASAESVLPDARLDLQRAFMVGAVEKAMGAAATRLVANAEGVTLMQSVLALLQRRHPQLTSPELTSLTDAVKAGKVVQWLEQ